MDKTYMSMDEFEKQTTKACELIAGAVHSKNISVGPIAQACITVYLSCNKNLGISFEECKQSLIKYLENQKDSWND